MEVRFRNDDVVSAGEAMREHLYYVVKNEFYFLEDIGFRVTKAAADEVRYESIHSNVVVSWDARSGELEIFIGLQPQVGLPGSMYALTDILDFEGAIALDRKRPFEVSDENRLQSFVRQLADEVRAYAQPALVGDRVFYGRLEAFRHTKAEALTRGINLRQVRSAAGAAWLRKDFKKVADLYTSIEGDLTEAEKRKLECARNY